MLLSGMLLHGAPSHPWLPTTTPPLGDSCHLKRHNSVKRGIVKVVLYTADLTSDPHPTRRPCDEHSKHLPCLRKSVLFTCFNFRNVTFIAFMFFFLLFWWSSMLRPDLIFWQRRCFNLKFSSFNFPNYNLCNWPLYYNFGYLILIETKKRQCAAVDIVAVIM